MKSTEACCPYYHHMMHSHGACNTQLYRMRCVFVFLSQAGTVPAGQADLLHAASVSPAAVRTTELQVIIELQVSAATRLNKV